ncbi:hypothetical protein [Pseudoxanthomonas mexicana]|nr:hypothetical protein [Pseudoxanthomonas mexicana]
MLLHCSVHPVDIRAGTVGQKISQLIDCKSINCQSGQDAGATPFTAMMI